MSTPQPHKASINLMKAVAVTVGVTVTTLLFTHPRFELESKRAVAQAATQQPNVVVIMADDLSRRELNEALNKGWMPNLKTHLINRGTTFTQSFVSQSWCCPSRSTFLTGQYPHNHGVLANKLPDGGVTRLDDSSTLATWLKRVGYRTCLVGKYLNGYGSNSVAGDPSDNLTYIPPGWSNWQALTGGANRQYNYIINDNGTLVDYGADPAKPAKEYQTDVLARRSVKFINESEASDPKPFFLFITPSAPHLPADPAPRHAGTASRIPLPQPPSFNEQNVRDKPAWFQNNVPELSPQKIAEIQRGYQKKLESLRAVDDLIASVVSALSQNRELKNTVLIFTSDNGFIFGEHRLIEKTHVYEESVRVPLFIRAPGFPKQSVSRLVINNDLAPTIVNFASAATDIPIDGRSLIPLLRQPSRSNWRKRFLVEHYQPVRNSSDVPTPREESPSYFALRTSSTDTETPSQLYAEYSGGGREFYDLAIDPYQLQSLHNEAGSRRQMQILQNRLEKLKVCSGRNCRTLEA